MFAVLLASSVSAVLSSIFFVLLISKSKEGQLSMGLYHGMIVCFFLFEMFNLIAHALFVMKYWLVSKKVHEFLTQQE